MAEPFKNMYNEQFLERFSKDLIVVIPDFDDFRMQPRVIRKLTNGKWEMSYGFPRVKSWGQGSMFVEIHVIKISPIENIMDRVKLKKWQAATSKTNWEQSPTPYNTPTPKKVCENITSE